MNIILLATNTDKSKEMSNLLEKEKNLTKKSILIIRKSVKKLMMILKMQEN